MTIRALITLILCLSASLASAVKANPGITYYTQPDGSVIEVILNGDENSHYASAPDGRLLSLDPDGRYTVAPVQNLLKVTNFSSRVRSTKSLTRASDNANYRYSSSVFPTVGSPRSLVILVEYQDYGFSMNDPLEYYEDFLNGESFSRDGATGSCRNYFIDNSSGKFRPTFDVYGPVKLKYNRKYYGGGAEENACMMVVESIEALDGQVDFSVYDNNDDGYVDSVYIIYPEKGQNDGGMAESVWPYSWELEEENVELFADGVKFNTYGCSNEINGRGEVNGIGTFVHEFGHVLGLPDLYNTLASDSTTPGQWSVMDNGNYNNDSRTPPNMSAFERYSLGWCYPEEIVESGQFSLLDITSSNSAYMMSTEEDPDEFFILENRQLEGWDSFLPASGMLAWRIEFIQKIWDENTVNNQRNHHYVELLRADNDKSSFSLDGDPYPGSSGVTELSRTTTPALASWYPGRTMNAKSIYNITEVDGQINFMAAVEENRNPTAIDFITSEKGVSVSGNMVTITCGKLTVFDISGRAVTVITPDTPAILPKGLYFADDMKLLVQ